MYIVPDPTVSVIAPNTQIVSQPLILQCEVTTVRGITSRVDIIWSSGGTILKRINDTKAVVMDNSLLYSDFYIISQLNTADDDRVILCKVVINATPLVMANDDVILNVTGEY